MRSDGAVALLESLPCGRVALLHQLEQRLCLHCQVLIDERLNSRPVRIHQQSFRGGRALRFVNLFGGFERDFRFTVGD